VDRQDLDEVLAALGHGGFLFVVLRGVEVGEPLDKAPQAHPRGRIEGASALDHLQEVHHLLFPAKA